MDISNQYEKRLTMLLSQRSLLGESEICHKRHLALQICSHCKNNFSSSVFPLVPSWKALGPFQRSAAAAEIIVGAPEHSDSGCLVLVHKLSRWQRRECLPSVHYGGMFCSVQCLTSSAACSCWWRRWRFGFGFDVDLPYFSAWGVEPHHIFGSYVECWRVCKPIFLALVYVACSVCSQKDEYLS